MRGGRDCAGNELGAPCLHLSPRAGTRGRSGDAFREVDSLRLEMRGGSPSPRPSPRKKRGEGGAHNSRALENANELTRRVFSSRISVRVIGGSARWLQFSRSQSRQLTPIGVPSAVSRSIPVA